MTLLILDVSLFGGLLPNGARMAPEDLYGSSRVPSERGGVLRGVAP